MRRARASRGCASVAGWAGSPEDERRFRASRPCAARPLMPGGIENTEGRHLPRRKDFYRLCFKIVIVNQDLYASLSYTRSWK
jgi:hypothetical protein